MPNQGKSRLRETVILALLVTSNYKTAAASAGVSERTVLRWKTQPSFQREYEAAKKKLAALVQDRLVGISLHAVSVLEQILDDDETPAAVRLGAVRTILEMARIPANQAESRERKPVNDEFEARLALLEKAIGAPLILLHSDGTTRRLNSTGADVFQAIPQLTADAGVTQSRTDRTAKKGEKHHA